MVVVRLRVRGMALALVMMMLGGVVMLGPAARRAAVRQEEDAPGGSLQGIVAAGGGEYLCSVRKWSRRGRIRPTRCTITSRHVASNRIASHRLGQEKKPQKRQGEKWPPCRAESVMGRRGSGPIFWPKYQVRTLQSAHYYIQSGTYIVPHHTSVPGVDQDSKAPGAGQARCSRRAEPSMACQGKQGPRSFRPRPRL